MSTKKYLILLLLVSIYGRAQFNIPPDVKVARLWGTGFSIAQPELFEVRSAKEFYFLLKGSNTDNIFKAQSHSYALRYAAAYKDDQFLVPLIKGRAPARDYPYLAISQKPQLFAGNTFVEGVSVSGGFYLHFFNFDQNTSSTFPPNTSTFGGLVSLSYQIQAESDGNFFVLCAPVDGLSEDSLQRYNTNGIDNDSLYLLKTNYSKASFDTVAIYRHPSEIDAWFNNYFGAFRFNPDDSSMMFVRKDSLFIYNGKDLWPEKSVAVPTWIDIKDIDDLEKENYFVTEVMATSQFGIPQKAKIKHWTFKNNSFQQDSFLVDLPHQEFWPKGEGFYSQGINTYMNRLNADKMEFMLEFKRVIEIDLERSVLQSLICRIDTAGNLIWSRRMFGEHFPAVISSYEEFGDSIILGGSYYPTPNYYRSVYYTKPFFRILDGEGNLLNQKKNKLSGIYPNPFSVDFIIEANGVEEVSVIDLRGSVIYKKEVPAFLAQHQVYYPDLDEGIYIIRMRFEDGSFLQQRILKTVN